MRHAGVLALALLLALSTGCTKTSNSERQGMPASTTPFEQITIAGIHLGSTRENTKRALGQPESTTDYPQQAMVVLEYPNRGLAVGITTTDQLVRALTLSYPSNIKTARGIGLGATEKDVRSAYGEPRDKSWAYALGDDVTLFFGFVDGHVAKMYVIWGIH